MKAYTLGLYEKSMPAELSWERKLEVAGKAGFDFVEISIDETDAKLNRLDMSKEERLQLVQTVYHTGIPIRSMCLSGHRKYPLGSENPDTAARSREIMKKAIQLADDLGVRIIQLAGYDVYYETSTEQTRRIFEENLRWAVSLAASRGILMGFETMETPFMDTVEKAMNYVSDVKNPYLQVYPDCGNLTNAALLYQGDVCQDLSSGKGHIVAMHLKETLPGKYRDVPFGTGHVNFQKVIRRGWELGVRRYVTEFWYQGSPSWKEALLDASRRMRSVLDEMEEADQQM